MHCLVHSKEIYEWVHFIIIIFSVIAENALLPLFPVHDAVMSGDLNYVKQMLYLGGDVNDLHFGGITPLHMACLSGHYQIAQYLIENGALVSVALMS